MIDEKATAWLVVAMDRTLRNRDTRRHDSFIPRGYRTLALRQLRGRTRFDLPIGRHSTQFVNSDNGVGADRHAQTVEQALPGAPA